VIALTIEILEYVQTWITFFCFKAWWVCFFVGFAVPIKLMMISNLYGLLHLTHLDNSTRKCRVSPFPAILTLWNAGVHISSSYSGDIPSYIETSINQSLGFAPTLNILNINYLTLVIL